MSATEKRAFPPGCRKLDDIVQECGLDHAQTNLISGKWSAFKCNLNTLEVTPIPAIIWGEARGRTWLEEGGKAVELSSGEKFVMTPYAVIVQVPEQQPRTQRKARQADRTDQAIAKHFPRGTDEFSTKAIYRAVAQELTADSKERGLAIPSETTVKRRLGRRK
jgi:hypothetical protein